jgi:hypothetical protein
MTTLRRLHMNFGKLFISASAAAVLITFAAAGRPTVAFAAPALTVQSEEAAHPRLVAAIREMREALRELEAAPDDFGGNKAAAIRDTRQAIHSVRKALYFRLRMDDAAIDRVQ